MGSSPIGHPTLKPPRKWQPPRLPRRLAPSTLFQHMQAAALAQIAANRAGVLRSSDPEYVHQLRVGLRRLRSALRAFRDLLPRKKSTLLARRTRRVMRKLGAARDWDVFAQWLEGEQAPRELPERVAQEQQAARDAARKALARLSLAPIEAKRSGPELGEFATVALARLERKARKQAQRMDWGNPRDRHVLRIRVKRLRYAAEFFAREQPQLKRLQELLGELNDVEVARRLLRKLSVREPSLAQALELRERRLLRALGRTKTSSFGQASGRRG